jgi:lambda repressor-like predicted transcriptional regulator
MEPSSEKSSLRVRALSGAVVYEGPRPGSLEELRHLAAVGLGLDDEGAAAELAFCGGDAVLGRIEEAGEEVTVVRDEDMGLLGEFVRHVAKDRGHLPESLWPVREHKRLVLAAIEQHGWALTHASQRLQADRDVVLAAVKKDGLVLRSASDQLRADRDVVLAAVASYGFALSWASVELRADRNVVLVAVAQDGRALFRAAPELRADRDVVLVAVAQSGRALVYAAPELKADRGIVLAAVAQNGDALQYASPELRASLLIAS